MRVVLASASPRRKALLAALGIPVEVHVSHAPEVDHGQDPESIVTANARAKRDAVLPGVEG
ncbi:MAG TPA: Maf family protein, partial [Candidatus Hydrogenedentes bacterium]|nr:Maf family protein [Candidatus Hydrogenedentota bacterium]